MNAKDEGMPGIEHFGISLKSSDIGFRICRENYAKVDNRSSIVPGVVYSDTWCQEHLEACLKNYDLNMKYFRSLDRDDFNRSLSRFAKTHRFHEITDMSECKGRSGYYILVFDDFCQAYIGTSENIRSRIRNHWSKRKPFDRLIFGSIENSILSIDSFRALDTTRIFVRLTKNVYTHEDKYVELFPAHYRLNRNAGGRMSGGFFEAISKGKTRSLVVPSDHEE